jgi:signal transduction histidine kinase
MLMSGTPRGIIDDLPSGESVMAALPGLTPARGSQKVFAMRSARAVVLVLAILVLGFPGREAPARDRASTGADLPIVRAQLVDGYRFFERAPLDAVAVLGAAGIAMATLIVALRSLWRGSRQARRAAGGPAGREEALATPAADSTAMFPDRRPQDAARAEQLAYVRELLQARTAEMERLALEHDVLAARLAEVQTEVDRWRRDHGQVTAELAAERGRARAGLATPGAGLSGLVDRETQHLYGCVVASVCFEVRRALNGILGYSRLLLRGVEGPLNRHQEEDVQIIEAAGDRLLAFVNDLDDLCHAVARTLPLRLDAVDVEAALREAAQTGAERLQRTPADFRVQLEPGLPVVLADRGRLAQILATLIEYGATRAGGEVTLSARPRNDLVAVSVAHPAVDAGESASRLDPLASDGDEDATRVRLALARELASLGGGELIVEKGESAGTVFTLTVPVLSHPGQISAA